MDLKTLLLRGREKGGREKVRVREGRPVSSVQFVGNLRPKTVDQAS